MSSFPRRTVYYLLVLVAATGVFASVCSLGMSV